MLEWAAAAGVETLPNFAHTFFNPPPAGGGPLRRWKRRVGQWRGRRRFAAALRKLDPAALLNHGEVAAADLRRLAPRPRAG